MKRLGAFLLALLLTAALLPAAAWGESETVICDAEGLRAFCEACRRESYSDGRSFRLENDIELHGEALCVPIFAGRFDGGGHTVSGLLITGDGSRQGFFRETTDAAEISCLHVSGTVETAGTGMYVGGVVGLNAGTVMDCSFDGAVSGVECVGGVVGGSTASGTVLSCAFSGSVQGDAKVGGIAGENLGVVVSCENGGSVNTSAVSSVTRQTFDISSVLRAAADGEPVETVLSISDIGGVAGYNGGSVLRCVNMGAVGYPHIGYNVGGIAGRSGGYVEACENSGEVFGRRDVGGIVGQLEPYASWELSESKLDELNTRMNALSDAVNAMLGAASAQSLQLSGAIGQLTASTDAAVQAMADMVNQSKTAVNNVRERVDERISELVPEPGQEDAYENSPGDEEEQSAEEEPEDALEEEQTDTGEEMPTDTAEQEDETTGSRLISSVETMIEDASYVAENMRNAVPDATALVDALGGVYSSAVWLGSSVGGVSASVMESAETVSARVSELLAVLASAVEDASEITVTQTDISVRRAYDQDAGAVSECVNLGAVQADTNAGGIAGTMGFEISYDLENELGLTELLFREAEHQVFSVIRQCVSQADITASKTAAGGIVGRMEFGAAADCEAAGTIASAGEYAGGIAANASGSIVDCAVRVSVSGAKYAGGIAGLSGDMSGCRALATITDAAEYAGCVAGWAEGVLNDNLFFDTGAGGVDGVERSGQTLSAAYSVMLAGEEVPAVFSDCVIRFEVEGMLIEERTVPFGKPVGSAPEVPEMPESYWQWDEYGEIADADMTVTGSYLPLIKVLSDGAEPAGILAEGAFLPEQTLVTEAVAVPDGDAIHDGVTVSVEGYEDPLTVRVRHEAPGAVYVVSETGIAPVEFETDGSYVVFSLPNGDSYYMTPAQPETPWALIGGVCGAALVCVGLVIRAVVKRKKIKTSK